MAKPQVVIQTEHEKEQPRSSFASDRSREELLAMLPVTENRLQLAGISTAVLEGGDGPPMILLHGPSGYAAHWMNVIPDLVGSHRVIVPDLPGHGASESNGSLEEDRVLAWLGELIERTCKSPPVLVGQLLSGAIALRFAIKEGHRLERLVLVDTFGLCPFQPIPEFGLALTQFLAQPTEQTHRTLWRHCAFNLSALYERMGDRWRPFESYNLDRARTPSVQAAVSALMQHFGVPAIATAELARIAVPTALIWGRHDRATPLSVAEAASRRHGWPVYVIEDSADDPSIEQPEAFLAALRAAISDNSASNKEDTSVTAVQQTRAAWNKIAPGYDAVVTSTHIWLGEEGLRRAGLRPGMTFLDVAAGSGALSIPAARMGARVLATDLSPVMLERLRQRAQDEGLTIETRVMDGHALDLDDNSFDIAGSQFGVMLFPDMPKGIRELARVAKTGGRVLMNVFGDMRKVEFFAFFMRGIQAVRPDFTGPPSDPPPLPFQLQDPERLRRELANAGLKDIRIEQTKEPLEFRSGEEMLDWLVRSNPIAEMVLGEMRVKDDERLVVQQALERLVRERAAGGDVATLTSPINIGIGTK
jgi:pimeloyl-ACP methyl ester carboxylesterase/ubiquinone/menaquinone biosynthesis C-methylase UbiE